jgi:2-oxoisovalerate dehydrogenase E2 component (dihydrolipoyl transacylase)
MADIEAVPGYEFRLPDLGEGLTEAEVLRWLVAVGEAVQINQPLVEVETAKAAVEIPSPVAGTVTALGAPEGEVLAVGALLVSLRVESVSGPAVLVGYGPRSGGPTQRRRRTTEATPVPAQPARASAEQPGRTRAAAKPPVRKLARDLGLDLDTIRGTGPGGLVTRADVERSARPAPEVALRPGPTDQRIPVRGVRRATADAMARSAAVPQAAVRLTVDVSEAVRLRERLAAASPDAVAPTFLSLVARAVSLALVRRPLLHARWDEANREIVLPASVSLGIAVAGPRGLLVPKIRDAEGRSVPSLSAEIARLAGSVRDGSIRPEELVGGTFTISNVGVFGVDGGTALLTPGETGILCLGAVRQRPWVADGALVVRDLVELTLTIDHRVVDGKEASLFLADVGSLVNEPGLMLGRP